MYHTVYVESVDFLGVKEANGFVKVEVSSQEKEILEAMKETNENIFDIPELEDLLDRIQEEVPDRKGFQSSSEFTVYPTPWNMSVTLVFSQEQKDYADYVLREGIYSHMNEAYA